MGLYRSLNQNGHREDLPTTFNWGFLCVLFFSVTFTGFMVVGAWDITIRILDLLSR